MDKPRILFLATSLNTGGTEKFLLTLARSLKSSYDIRIGVLKSGGALQSELEAIGLRVEVFSSPWRLLSYLKDNRIELLHTFLFWAHIIGRIFGKLSGVPVIVTTQQAVDTWKYFYHTLLDRITAPLCDFFIANSKAAADRIMSVERVPREKIAIIYNGIDPAVFPGTAGAVDIRKELGIQPGVFVVACISRLHRDKGADRLADITEACPGCVFLIAGDGPLRPALERRAATPALRGTFLLCGWRSDIPELLKASDVFILPSREESFPQAALEAMSCGLPVVASDVGGIRELVEHGVDGVLVKSGDTEGYARALRSIASDRGLAERLSKNAALKAARFGEKEMVSSVSAIYFKLLTAAVRYK